MLALLLLVCWPVAEIFVAVVVARAIGVLSTVLLLILSWPVGVWALRAQGRAAWRRLGVAVGARRAPGREVLDGALVLVGGVLLIIPGFITDALGALALLPPTRALMRRWLVANLHRRWLVRATHVTGTDASDDVDSTATDVDQPQIRP